MSGIELTETEAAERAAAELKAERQLSPRERLERRMGTSLEKKSEDAIVAAFQTIDKAANSYLQTLGEEAESNIMQTITRARAINTIQTALTDDVLNIIVKPMENLPTGFKTDRPGDPKGYPLDVLRSCVTQAMLHGARIDNNEFNIIKGVPMLVLNYWDRRVKELPGVSNVEIKCGEIEYKGREALVDCLAKYMVDGKEHKKVYKNGVRDGGMIWDLRVKVPCNDGMGRDALEGKVKRRVLKDIYQQLTGRWIDGMDEDEPIDAESTVVEATDDPEPDTKQNPESGSLFPEDSQDVADFQSQLKSDYFSELANKDTKKGVSELMKHAKENKQLAPHTLEEIVQAVNNKLKSLKD